MSEQIVLVDGRIVSPTHSRRESGKTNRKSVKLNTAKLAAEITRQASKQTYWTIKLFVDRNLVEDAYRAYAYFRWVDDYCDEVCRARCNRLGFVQRQRHIIAKAYAGEKQNNLTNEERLVVDLIRNDKTENSGIRAYIDNMMAVMAFDAARRGALISEAELAEYTRWLATAVTEALHHFIGYHDPAPVDETRYTAVTAAHITHMLRDTVEDVEAGYFNVPKAYLTERGMDANNVAGEAFRPWVEARVALARKYFEIGRQNMARIPNLRRRIAGYAYIARFEVVLDLIERDGYKLRFAYPERKSKHAALKMGWAALSQAFRPVFSIRKNGTQICTD